MKVKKEKGTKAKAKAKAKSKPKAEAKTKAKSNWIKRRSRMLNTTLLVSWFAWYLKAN